MYFSVLFMHRDVCYLDDVEFPNHFGSPQNKQHRIPKWPHRVGTTSIQPGHGGNCCTRSVSGPITVYAFLKQRDCYVRYYGKHTFGVRCWSQALSLTGRFHVMMMSLVSVFSGTKLMMQELGTEALVVGISSVIWKPNEYWLRFSKENPTVGYCT